MHYVLVFDLLKRWTNKSRLNRTESKKEGYVKSVQKIRWGWSTTYLLKLKDIYTGGFHFVVTGLHLLTPFLNWKVGNCWDIRRWCFQKSAKVFDFKLYFSVNFNTKSRNWTILGHMCNIFQLKTRSSTKGEVILNFNTCHMPHEFFHNQAIFRYCTYIQGNFRK